MNHSLKNFAILLALSYLAVGVDVFGQKKELPPLNLNYDKDPCGNPFMESQLWAMVRGKTMKVIDGSSFEITTRYRKRITIHLAGVEVPQGNNKFAEGSRSFLQNLIAKKEVEILVSPSDWPFRKKKSKELIGVTHTLTKDISLEMIRSGMAVYKAPKPYSMSNYTSCTYELAEREARKAKVGIWKDVD